MNKGKVLRDRSVRVGVARVAKAVNGAPFRSVKKETKEKDAIVVGRNFDFWLSDGDSIYDKLFGDEI